MKLNAAIAAAVAAGAVAAAPHNVELPTVQFPPIASDDYMTQRAKLVAQENAMRFSAQQPMDEVELAANETWTKMRLNLTELYEAKLDFPPSRYFEEIKPQIEATDLFSVIQGMPKGGALHLHSTTGIGTPEGMAQYVVDNPTGMYVLWDEDCDPWNEAYPDSCPYKNSWGEAEVHGHLEYLMADWTPDEGFAPVSEVAANVTDFVPQLAALLQMDARSNPEDSYDAWGDFMTVMGRYSSLFYEQGFFNAAYMETFRTMAEDNVDYVELRTGLWPATYDASSESGYSDCQDAQSDCSIQQLVDMRDQVRAEGFPDFDIKTVFAGHRSHSNQENLDAAGDIIQLKQKWPDMVMGFDMVGPEDEWAYDPSNPTTLKAVPALLTALDWAAGNGTTLPLFLHDGESTWADNDNIWDAFLLGCQRIGHGIDLFHYPLVQQYLAASKQTALEVCPISNQILQYTRDLRMHPALSYIKAGVPIVVAPDDPGIYGYTGLSLDFWEAAMAWELDLRDMKQIIVNSYDYSAMGQDDKDAAKAAWQTKWDAWVEQLAA